MRIEYENKMNFFPILFCRISINKINIRIIVLQYIFMAQGLVNLKMVVAVEF